MGGQHTAEEVANEGCVVWQRSEAAALAARSCKRAAMAEQDETQMQSASTGPPYHLQLQDTQINKRSSDRHYRCWHNTMSVSQISPCFLHEPGAPGCCCRWCGSPSGSSVSMGTGVKVDIGGFVVEAWGGVGSVGSCCPGSSSCFLFSCSSRTSFRCSLFLQIRATRSFMALAMVLWSPSHTKPESTWKVIKEEKERTQKQSKSNKSLEN